MSDLHARIAQLERELARLSDANTQQQHSLSILHAELSQLRTKIVGAANENTSTDSAPQPVSGGPPPLPVAQPVAEQARSFSYKTVNPAQPAAPPLPPRPKKPRTPSQLEKMIGENIFPLIGIAVLVLGVGIGAKLAIENGLISPLTRIVFGYIVGLGLLGFAEKLRKKYARLSAVLLGGGMAVLYFITYAAYDFYDLIPQGLTFGLMVAFTAFTAFASLRYNRQIIALLGLVGAYAVPFLLSTGDGNILTMLTYVALVNVGILIVSFQRNWRILLYTSFVLSWAILSVTILSESAEFIPLMSFAAVYFFMFYSMAVVRPWFKKAQVQTSDIILLVTNAILFFGLGFFLLDEQEDMQSWLGAFTLANAGVHLLIGMLMQRRGITRGNLQPLLAGLALIFVVIAIPVQLDGNYVTIIWAALAVLLLWMSQRAKVPAVRWFAYPLFALAFISLLDDYEAGRRSLRYVSELEDSGAVASYRPFLNQLFLTSGVVALAFGIGTWLTYRRETLAKVFDQIAKVVFPLATLLILYSMFFQEIDLFFEAKYQA